ncbi:MAG: hypothetical protein ACOC1P_03980 [Minisyncoccales bacterium]
MAIDYEFQEKNQKILQEVSFNLLKYFEKNPDRAEKHYDFVDKIKLCLSRDIHETSKLSQRINK